MTDGQRDEKEKRQWTVCGLDRSFVFVQVDDSLTRGCNFSSWLLCQLNWLAKVVDAPETARPSCTESAFFLFRR